MTAYITWDMPEQHSHESLVYGKTTPNRPPSVFTGCKLASADSRLGIPFCTQDLLPCQSQQGALKQYQVLKLPLKPFLSQPTGVPTRKSFKFLGQFSMGIKKSFVTQCESHTAFIGQVDASFRSLLLLSRNGCFVLVKQWTPVVGESRPRAHAALSILLNEGGDCFTHFWRIWS